MPARPNPVMVQTHLLHAILRQTVMQCSLAQRVCGFDIWKHRHGKSLLTEAQACALWC